jgi:hypothetical protein
MDIVKILSVIKCSSCIYSDLGHADVFTYSVTVLIIKCAWRVMDDSILRLLICIEVLHTAVNFNVQCVFTYWLTELCFKSLYELSFRWECVVMYTE